MKVLMFSATWCQPCKSMKPIVKSVCESRGIDLTIVNVDEDPDDLCLKYGIRQSPTLVILNGDEETRLNGFHDAEDIEEALDSI